MNTEHNAAIRHPEIPGYAFYGWTVKLIENLHRAYEHRRAIRQLQAMPDRMLKDIGITRGEIPAAVRGLHQPLPVTLKAAVETDPSSTRAAMVPEPAANSARYSAVA